MQYSGPLSDKQKVQLGQFRANVQDILKPEHDDEYLLRWIRAREWDLKKAEQMLRTSVDWRKKYGADTLVDWDPPEVLKKYIPGGYCGHNKECHPIWYELIGRHDLRGLFYSATHKDIVKYRVAQLEKLYVNIFPEYSKKFGKRIDKFTFIMDLDAVTLKFLWKPAIDVYTELLSTYEANYPETLGRCLVINSPPYLPILYNVVKPFLAEYTRSKIRFLGKNWKQDILEYIDADQLPVQWGGTKKDPDGDPFCKSELCLGGPVPESYNLKVTDEVDLSQYTTVSVSRAGSTQLEFPVEETGSLLSWNFWTFDKDIAFGVYRRTANERQKKDEMEEIVGNCRVNSHIVPESGNVVCEKTGTYVVRFDNTYSWVNAKKVSYLIQVLTPDKELLQKQTEITSF